MDEEESTSESMGRKEYEDLRKELLAVDRNKAWKPYTAGQGNTLTKEGEMYESTICKVLRSKDPSEQKVHGKAALNFDSVRWKEPSIASTIAACITRAELDVHLRELYVASAGKVFVEGSVSGVTWGVGLSWKKPHIGDEAFWRGENRLGRCHGEAAQRIRDMFEQDRTQAQYEDDYNR